MTAAALFVLSLLVHLPVRLLAPAAVTGRTTLAVGTVTGVVTSVLGFIAGGGWRLLGGT